MFSVSTFSQYSGEMELFGVVQVEPNSHTFGISFVPKLTYIPCSMPGIICHFLNKGFCHNIFLPLFFAPTFNYN